MLIRLSTTNHRAPKMSLLLAACSAAIADVGVARPRGPPARGRRRAPPPAHITAVAALRYLAHPRCAAQASRHLQSSLGYVGLERGRGRQHLTQSWISDPGPRISAFGGLQLASIRISTRATCVAARSGAPRALLPLQRSPRSATSYLQHRREQRAAGRWAAVRQRPRPWRRTGCGY